MSFIDSLLGHSTTNTLLIISLIGFFGILLGKVNFGSFKLGISAVLFVGLFIGHIGAEIDIQELHFIKSFGLILFIYTTGIQLGPRFLASLRNDGLRLNSIAVVIVLLGFFSAVLIKYIFDLDVATIAGLFTGGVTNTPGLGAAQSLITEQLPNGSTLIEKTGMAYAVAYPFGIIGVILTMLLIKKIYKVNVDNEIANYRTQQQLDSGIETIQVKVTNPNLTGVKIASFDNGIKTNFVISRILRNGTYHVPEPNFVLAENDILVGLSKKEDFDAIALSIGEISKQDKFEITGNLTMKHIRMTNRKLSGKRLQDVALSSMFPANITRIFRADAEIIPSKYTTFEFGDVLRVVGRRSRMEAVSNFLGNSIKNLSSPNLVPLFIGIFVGVLFGSIPIFIPGLPSATKLGLAGGPLIISLILGYKGRIGNLDFYMTPSANRFIRELGIVLFLSSVGLSSGAKFWSTLVDGGYMWMIYASFITLFPVLVGALIGRFLKINYLTICGYLCGSMTGTPALEFANDIASSQAQATAYATVYPLTMFLRILFSQILVLLYT